MKGQTTLAEVGTLVLAALLLLSLGALTGMVLTGAGGQPREADRIAEERSKDYDLTNPLLDCEGAGDTIGDLALRPFKDELAGVVGRLVRRGLVRQVSVYFRDLNNGPWYGINENVAFSPAGLLKVPLAMAVMKEAESDPSLLKRLVSAPRHGRSSTVQSVPADSLVPGQTYTVEALLEIMLTRSDADAAALLSERVAPLIVSSVFSDLDVPAPAEEVRDYLSVRSFSRFFRVLFNASYLTRRSSEHLLSLLSRSSFRSGIAAGVPDDIAVASRYGEQELGPQQEIKELHDCGIVYYPNSPYLLCVMTLGDRFEGNAAAIREVSMFVYTTVDAHFAGSRGRK